jgi:hypothetical protein
MGQAKEQMMREEELQPFYEWLEDQYGEESPEADSEEWELAYQEFEASCRERARLEEEEWRQSELEWYIYTTSEVGKFDKQMLNVRELLGVNVGEEANFSLLVMLHGHIVAAIESYLATTFIHKVTNSGDLTRRLVETDPKFKNMKISFKEIFEKKEKLQLIVAEYLQDLIFHDLAKVKPMFKEVLNCDFGDVEWLFKAVRVRHHCVHRAGVDKEGNRVDLSAESIGELLISSSQLVHDIEMRLKENGLSA